MIRVLLPFFFLLLSIQLHAQKFSKADSLRGALRVERTFYDVTYYDLELSVDLERQRLKGRHPLFRRQPENCPEVLKTGISSLPGRLYHLPLGNGYGGYNPQTAS